MKNITRKNSQAGFTIIEVVVSLFILGIVLLVYAAASNTMVLNRMARDQEVAYRIAAGKIENLRGTAYDSLPASGSFSDPLLANLPSASGNIAVTDSDTRTKQIVVTVSWTEAGRPQSSVALTTLIAEGGLGQ